MHTIGVSRVECRSRKEQLHADKLAFVISRGPLPLGKLQRSRVYHIRATGVQPIRLLAVSSAGQGDVLSLLRHLESFSSSTTLRSFSILNSNSH
jgi:hypothetical protein